MVSRNVRTLVIGGFGFIGLSLVQKLSNIGREITVLGRRDLKSVPVLDNVSYVQGDFADVSLIKTLLDNHEEVINLAYASKPNTSFDNPIADLEDNLSAAINLFLEVSRRRLKLIVISSGGTVYGQTEAPSLVESDPTWPISPYGLTKLTIEHYAHLYAATKGLNYTCLRIANAYGVGQEPYAGQGFISTAIALTLQGKPVKIFGNGDAVRDYVYVDDVAQAICLALERAKPSNTYNIGSGKGKSILDIMATLEPLMGEVGCTVACEYFPGRSFDVRRNVLNCSKAHIELGWSDTTNFIQGLRRTRDWMLESGYAR